MECGMEHVTDIIFVISQRWELIGVGVNWAENPLVTLVHVHSSQKSHSSRTIVAERSTT